MILDNENCCIWANDKTIKLTKMQSKMLNYLIINKNNFIPNKELSIYMYREEKSKNIQALINQINKLLDSTEYYITNRYRFGYKLVRRG